LWEWNESRIENGGFFIAKNIQCVILDIVIKQ
jgi:hypothetical protein